KDANRAIKKASMPAAMRPRLDGFGGHPTAGGWRRMSRNFLRGGGPDPKTSYFSVMKCRPTRRPLPYRRICCASKKNEASTRRGDGGLVTRRRIGVGGRRRGCAAAGAGSVTVLRPLEPRA